MARARQGRRLCFRCGCSKINNLMLVEWLHGSGQRTWTLHPPAAEGEPTPEAIDGKRCPTGVHDFSPFSLDEMLDNVWPGDRSA